MTRTKSIWTSLDRSLVPPQRFSFLSQTIRWFWPNTISQNIINVWPLLIIFHGQFQAIIAEGQLLDRRSPSVLKCHRHHCQVHLYSSGYAQGVMTPTLGVTKKEVQNIIEDRPFGQMLFVETIDESLRTLLKDSRAMLRSLGIFTMTKRRFSTSQMAWSFCLAQFFRFYRSTEPQQEET